MSRWSYLDTRIVFALRAYGIGKPAFAASAGRIEHSQDVDFETGPTFTPDWHRGNGGLGEDL